MPVSSPPWPRKSALPAVLAIALVVLGTPLSLHAQRPLEHSDVLAWNSLADPLLSADGAWVTYTLEPFEGDPVVVIRAARANGEEFRARGENPAFVAGAGFVVYSVPPPEEMLDSLRAADVDADELPGDSLAFVRLGSALQGEVLGAHETFKVAEDGPWVAWLSETETETDADAEGTEEPEAEDVPEAKQKDDGRTLHVRNLETGENHRYDRVAEYVFSGDGSTLVFARQSKTGQDDGVIRVALDTGQELGLLDGPGHYGKLATTPDGSRIGFLSDQADWDADRPRYAVYAWTEGRTQVQAGPDDLQAGWVVSEDGDVSLSEDGRQLRFGVRPAPAPERDDDTPEDERVEVDVWNWKDPYLQPMQLVQADDERTRSYAAVVHLAGSRAGQVVTLASQDVPDVQMDREASHRYVLATSDVPYRQLMSWDGRYTDAWAVDTWTGERRRVGEAIKGFQGARLSPDGTWAYWWDGEARQWMGAELASGAATSLSAGVDHPLWNELDDHPDLPPPYGAAGWTEGDAAFVFYDEFDVWRFDPETGQAINVTGGTGRDQQIRLRVQRLDPESDYVPSGEAWFTAFDPDGKQAGLMKGRTDRTARPQPVVMADARFRVRAKAADADTWLVSRETFRDYPDLHVTSGTFMDLVRVSDANPQQADYAWGDAELVEWVSNDGIPLQGMLFTPDGFDPAHTYPMMVYFYERMSDGLHSYRMPTPGSSSISIPFYVSRGYTVFVPDIPYEIGYPGESALDAVVPGVLSLVDRGFVDTERIGVQGHSWGGYQIAYMITKTHLFAAAEAGAPVANMTSAYGGIRWQTGMSRMFQYERTQSRIGGTLWEATNEYLHNSPLFYADKIQTPLLMMHNDADGAVPWYQGIEMFVAMRRLQKPVWMLNYNGEAHGLRQDHNRKDWAIRMQQFFDHYLMGAPAPVWMEEGVPAVLKGQTLGTELVAPVGPGVSN